MNFLAVSGERDLAVIRRLLPVCPRAKRLANKQQSSEAFAESWLRSLCSRVVVIRRLLRSLCSRVAAKFRRTFRCCRFFARFNRMKLVYRKVPVNPRDFAAVFIFIRYLFHRLMKILAKRAFKVGVFYDL